LSRSGKGGGDRCRGHASLVRASSSHKPSLSRRRTSGFVCRCSAHVSAVCAPDHQCSRPRRRRPPPDSESSRLERSLLGRGGGRCMSPSFVLDPIPFPPCAPALICLRAVTCFFFLTCSNVATRPASRRARRPCDMACMRIMCHERKVWVWVPARARLAPQHQQRRRASGGYTWPNGPGPMGQHGHGPKKHDPSTARARHHSASAGTRHDLHSA
jgi:hypothetical protein